MSYEVGWYGIPGSASYATKTHIAENRKPLCRAAIRRKAEFQMCSNGIYWPSIECKRCKAAWEKRQSDIEER